MIFIGNRYEITDRPVYIEENKLYNAYDSEKNINVKIKIIENNRYISIDFIPNIIDESMLINDLKNPYILSIIDVGVQRTVDNLLYYIVYEDFRGVSLSTLIKGAYLHMDALVRISTQITKALQAYESIGKYHGSLKPDDILVDDKHAIKIADFGITEANRGTNIRCSGNLKYMSPSQLSIDFTDIKTDLYCLGVILYEAVFKKFPFHEAHTEKQLMKEIDKGVIWSKQNLNNQNKDFINIIKKLLERNKNLGFKDYNELLLSLSHFMYKTSKIYTDDIEEEETDLEAVLDKTGRVNPDDFYKTNKISLKEIDEALEKEKASRKLSVKRNKGKKQKKNFKKIAVTSLIAIIVVAMLISYLA
ncbi:protein kinase domain-containing protein [Peptostreptococcus faecalis]|uniref:protein kinase domain-containing protein n=1 Tax=Peptostreptococcus faecalis TaxID=2045015 RepID=UPI000C7C94EC|nr:protein kinase [Peptostreptococcus faecalis]